MKAVNKCFLIFTLLFITPFSAVAFETEKTTKNRMLADLDAIHHFFDAIYAPWQWKYSYSGWDLSNEINKAKQKVENASPITTKAYQRIVRDFFNSMKDYHVGVRFYSTEEAFLPFLVKEVEGRYFITHIDTERLSSSSFNVTEGCELVQFNGRPTGETIQEILEQEIRTSNPETDRAVAALVLTYRSGKAGHIVPRGPISIGFKMPYSDQVHEMELIWQYTPEKISNFYKGIFTESNEEDKTFPQDRPLVKNKAMREKMVSVQLEFFENLQAQFLSSKDLIGSSESFVPSLGRIWWESKDRFYKAYLYENDDHRLIGYIRIPHYMAFEAQVDEFAKIISFFQERSDALVIDQLNNYGGFHFLVLGLASMLTNKPLQLPNYRQQLTQEDIAMAVQELELFSQIKNDKEATHLLGPSLFGIPVTYQLVQFFINYYEFILSEWEAGRILTDPYPLVLNKLNPHPKVNYTKPILILINHLDFSGGDLLPAILQDNHIATLFGSRTAGAGGTLNKAAFPNCCGISYFTYTSSIAERGNKNPIENLGVIPDIPYTITVEDLRCDYENYGKEVNKAIKGLLNPKAPSEKPPAITAEGEKQLPEPIKSPVLEPFNDDAKKEGESE